MKGTQMSECNSGSVLFLGLIAEKWVKIWIMARWINPNFLVVVDRFIALGGMNIESEFYHRIVNI